MSTEISCTFGDPSPAVTMPFSQDFYISVPLLPTELVHDIVEVTLEAFWHDLLLEPVRVEDWSAVGVLLQVSQVFRSCTIRCMDPLWGGKFVEDGANIKQTLSLLRRYSEVAMISPEELSKPPLTPCASHSLLQESKIPVVNIVKRLIGGCVSSRMRTRNRSTAASLAAPSVPGFRLALGPAKAFSNTGTVVSGAIYDYMIERFLPWSRAFILRSFIDVLESVVGGGRLPEESASILEQSHQAQPGISEKIADVAKEWRDFISEVTLLMDLPAGAFDQEITTDVYDFPFNIWNTIVAALSILKAHSPEIAEMWERGFAHVMSTADKEKLFPEVSLDAE